MRAYSKKEIEIIQQSPFFDAEWYCSQYRDLALLDMPPAEHYLWLGYKLNRDPSIRFSTSHYVAANPDVRKAGVNPLLHFIKWGQAEGRSPLPHGAVQVIHGNRKRKAGWLNVLLCAHEVHAHLFGGERSFLDVLGQLAELEANVFITIPKNANPEYVQALRGKSAAIFRFHYPLWQTNKAADEHVHENMRAVIIENNIDVVYANTIFLRDIQNIAKELGRKSFCHVRELIDNDAHLKKRIGLNTPEIVADLWKRSDYLIANSRATQRAFSADDIPVYAPNVVDCEQFDLDNRIGDTINFGIISSNAPKKGVADFVELAHICADVAPHARFFIIGPRNAFIEELEQQSLPRNLVVKGYAKTPQDALSDVNVVLSLSHFAESFGRTVAEAQAARRPVIAYGWGAVPELIEDGVTGFLVPHRDSAAAAQAVKRLCESPSLIESMGEAGREKMLREYSPSVLRDALRTALSKAMGREIALRVDSVGARVTVIVPVYNGYDAVKRCLESVKLWTLPEYAEVLVVNDGSTDPAISPMLKSYEEPGRIRIVENEANLGYTRTINKAIALCPADDVILLNSDTIVTPRWVEGLRATAYSHDNIGTATAMGDNAGAFSFPKANESNPKPIDASHALWAAALVRGADHCEPVEVPTGNGFCIYIRREVFEQIGLFDEELFPRGYGEENDFCMRAKAAGWRNVISPKSYIFHERTVSFGAEKAALVEQAQEILTKRHPTYFREVRAAFSSKGIQQLRDAVACVGRLADATSPSGGQMLSPASKFVSLNEQLINWPHLIDTADKRVVDLISIIICVYNNPELTEKCVQSVIANTVDSKIEIILVDNGSDAKTIDVLHALDRDFSEVRLVLNYENLNFSLGNNIGFSASVGARVVFLNNDTEVTRNWLEPLLAPLASDSVKGAQPRLLFPDGTIQCVGVVFSGHGPLGYPIYSGKPNEDRYAGKKRKFKAVTGACLALRAADFASAHGFDPRFINGQEDVDLCLRLGAGTPSFAYVPTSIVYHFEGKTQGRGRHIIHNRTELLKRWNDKVVGDDKGYYQDDGLLAKDYEADVPQFLEQGIACWRPTRLVNVPT